jgi:hypothetical protein
MLLEALTPKILLTPLISREARKTKTMSFPTFSLPPLQLKTS